MVFCIFDKNINMATINLTNKEPLKTLNPLEMDNKSQITFEKCFVKSGIKYKSGLSLIVEFKVPTRDVDEEGGILYLTSSKPILIGSLITAMDKENSPIVNINKPINIPVGCTILNIYGSNKLSTLFDFDIYYFIQ